MTVVLISIFLVSAAALGLELVLVRILSISHWHHFSYLVISTALLGFGAGGTLISIGSKFFTKNHKQWLWGLAFGLGLVVPTVFIVCQKVPLDELQLIWDRRQIFYLSAYYLLFFIPFFFAGSFIALAFTVWGNKAHRLYFYNMAGSGIGIGAVVLLMYGNPPEVLLLLISSTGFLAAAILASGISRKLATLVLGAVYVVIFLGPLPLEIEISENKSLVYYTALPQAETVAVDYSPLGRLDCVKAPGIRHFPGLSIAYQGRLPQQILIISDADSISAINHFEQLSDIECFDHMTSAVGYHLLSEPSVCIIGSGGGSDVAQALVGGAGKVTAVEINPQIIELVRDKFDEFSGSLYKRENVKLIVAEGRNFLQTSKQQFDIINISLLDSFSASAAGVYALNESHLYTIEAIEQALRRLKQTGLLSITRILKTPPRDSLKILATAAEALRRRGIVEPAEHIIMIRSWITATIVVSPQPFSKLQIANARNFAGERSFDLVQLPGISLKDANQFHILDEPIHYKSAQQILSPEYETFYRNYSYNIRPATDNKPYFFDFFRWKSVPHMIRTISGRWLPFAEWGYLVLAATLVQALIASCLFILLPLLIAKPIKSLRTRKFPALVYFLLLGLVYMFLEMGFIQKLTLLIGHPVFGVAVTLSGFLFFSGCGSLVSCQLVRKFKTTHRLIWLVVLAIIVIGIAEITFLTTAFDWLVGLPRTVRILLGLAITCPLAFFMGMPFPTVLREVAMHSQPLVPWAWGVNGFASVVGAVLGTLLAISFGFTVLVLMALAGYFFAAIVSKQIVSPR